LDLIAGLKSELFKPLVTLLVPGAIAVGPYVLVAHGRIPACETFWKEHSVAFVSVVLIGVIAAGLVLENIGSRIESGWDKLLGRKIKGFEDDWHAYLRLRNTDDVVGQRYLRTILTRMKFELSAAPALVFHIFGMVWVKWLFDVPGWLDLIIIILFLIVLTIYLVWESFSSAKVLAKVRADIIASCRKDEKRPAT
jgi:hypothetical protein